MAEKTIALLTAVLIILSGCSRKDKTQPDTCDPDETYYGPYEVIEVIDGDTVCLDIDGRKTKVRLIGIDAPESVHPDESKNTEEGKKASKYLFDLLDSRDVFLTLDVSEKDSYGRLLGYLWLEDGAMVNLKIVEDGYAVTMTVPPDVKYADAFAEAEKKARNEGCGLWG